MNRILDSLISWCLLECMWPSFIKTEQYLASNKYRQRTIQNSIFKVRIRIHGRSGVFNKRSQFEANTSTLYWFPSTTLYVRNPLILRTFFSSKTTLDNPWCSSGYFRTLNTFQNFIRADLVACKEVFSISTKFVIHHTALQGKVCSKCSMQNMCTILNKTNLQTTALTCNFQISMETL